MTSLEKQILQYLVRAGMITQDQARDLGKKAEDQHISAEIVIARDLKISSDDLLQIKARLTATEPRKLEAGREPSPEVLQQIPEEAAQQYFFVPLEKTGNILFVGMVNPQDLKAREALRFVMSRSSLVPRIVVITRQDFEKVFNRYRTVQHEVSEALKHVGEGKKLTKEEEAAAAAEAVGILKEAPITKIVSVLLRHATEGNASDIHVEPTEGQTHIRFRMEGVLYTSIFLPKNIHSAVVARIKILSGMRLDESRIPQDGRFHIKIDNAEYDFRVSTFPTVFGEKVAIRILDPTFAYQKLSDLGLSDLNLQRIQEAVRLPFGSILISGPTGSGKSTTLYGLLQLLPKEKINIVTLEDPVEYYIEGVNQSQIKEEIGYTFASGLRNILRQDPDVIMVGEIRDNETAELATHAALTGHIVFSTIHTNNSVGVILRLVDMGVDAYLIPSSLAVAASQRLAQRLCPYCKRQGVASEAMSKIIEGEMNALPVSFRERLGVKKPYTVYNSPGCARCEHRGTKGRIAIFEVFIMTPELRRLIATGHFNETNLQDEGKRQGMTSLRQDAIIKALRGIISMEEVLRLSRES